MDAQSLLLEPEYGGLDPSPIDQILRAATEVDAWETVGACANCDSRTICPFRQNAAWLRDEGLRQHLLRALRMAELGTRQRWNFRNVFSLTAEILVGDWGDFGDARHPCDWVHARTALVRERDEVTDAVRPLRELVSRLYPHALAPVGRVGPMPTEPVETAEERGYRVTLAIEQEEGRLTTQAHSYIRRFLQDEFSERLDPATYSSGTRADAIRAIEDAYSVSIRLANRSWPGSHAPAGAERMYLRLLAVAESEWDILDTESARAVAAVAYLRAAATCLAKRSLGTRSGRFAGTGHLEKYMRILRNPDEWWALNDDVLDLLGGEKMHFDATGTFGQPRPSEEPLVSLHVDFRPRPIMPAPQPTPERPAHDLPFLEIAGVYMPLTFDLYEALMYRQEGAPGGSLPASVQTAIDLVRHVHAGKKSRAPSFIDERARYVVGDFGQIEAGPSGHPVFRARR